MECAMGDSLAQEEEKIESQQTAQLITSSALHLAQ
jgi:hypothetical protein